MRELLIATLITTASLVVIIAGAVWYDKASCNRINENGTTTRYKLVGGCYVEVNGRFIPVGNWRGEYEL